MDKLLSFLNRLAKQERQDFCRRVGTTEAYLRKAASIGQMLRVELCVNIERESRREVTREDLRPSDYSRLWPELAESPAMEGQQ